MRDRETLGRRTGNRLLPWSGEGGKECHLSTDDDGSFLSRLADNLEAVQLGMAEDMLTYVQATVAVDGPSETEQLVIIRRLCEALRDALRVAESRGDRLTSSDDDDEGDDGEVSRAADAVLDREIAW